jgi:hypothetical protein
MRSESPKTRMICIFKAIYGLSVFVFPSGALAQNSEAVKLIVETASELCRSIPLEHSTTGVTLNADASAKVDGVIGRLVTLGAEGATNYKEENTKGLLGNDLAAAIQDENSCKLKVLTILTDRLLTAPKTEAAPNDWRREAKISDYTVQSSTQFCSRLQALVVSAKRKFKGDIIKTESLVAGGVRHKVTLPNTVWCAINYMPVPSGKTFPYFSCALFGEEKSADVAYSKYAAYQHLVADCLGSQWISGIQDRVIDKGAETKMQKDGDDPTVVLRTLEGKEGIGMYIYVDPPGIM